MRPARPRFGQAAAGGQAADVVVEDCEEDGRPHQVRWRREAGFLQGRFGKGKGRWVVER